MNKTICCIKWRDGSSTRYVIEPEQFETLMIDHGITTSRFGFVDSDGIRCAVECETTTVYDPPAGDGWNEEQTL